MRNANKYSKCQKYTEIWFAKSFPKICLIYVKDLPNIWLRLIFARYLPEICMRYAWYLQLRIPLVYILACLNTCILEYLHTCILTYMHTCILGCPYLQKFGPLILPQRYVIPMYEYQSFPTSSSCGKSKLKIALTPLY